MSDTPQSRPLRIGRGWGKALVVSTSVIFGLLIAFSVASGLWSIASTQQSGPAPNQLAGYHLTTVMVGPEAIAEVNGLHGKEIDVVDAWVGHYQGGGAVWVAQAASEEKARQLLDDMVRRIQDGGSPFRGLTPQAYKGLTVYSVTDGRQMHFFYQRSAKVVWVATPPAAEEDFFAAAFRKVG